MRRGSIHYNAIVYVMSDVSMFCRVECVNFEADGSNAHTIISGGKDGFIKYWNTERYIILLMDSIFLLCVIIVVTVYVHLVTSLDLLMVLTETPLE